ncbi:hypothetical protein HDU96_006113, partial [Phlyctochytrium bullatum]
MPATIRSSDAGPETTLTFVNKTSSTLNIFWIDNNGKATKYHSVEPNRSVEQPTYTNHAWEIVNASTSESLATHLAQITPQTLTVRPNAPLAIAPVKTEHDGPETFIKFINASSSTIEVFWVDRKGKETSYRTLAPRSPSQTQQTYTGHAWKFVAKDTKKVVGYHVASAVPQTVILNGENDFDIYPTARKLKSTGSGPVEVFWVDWEGQETSYLTLNNNQIREQQTHATHAWKFVGKASGKVIGYHRAVEQKQTLTLKGEDIIEVTATGSSVPAPTLVSGDAGPETTLSITNSTPHTIHALWISTEGKEVPYLILSPGQSQSVNTYANHAWKIVDGGKVLGQHLAAATPQTITLSGPTGAMWVAPTPAAAAPDAGASKPNPAAVKIGKTLGFIKDVAVAAFMDDGEGEKRAEGKKEKKESAAKVTAELIKNAV